jgi:beta-xylosidase
MDEKIYRLWGIEAAMQLLRPGATWEITDGRFTIWEDPRLCPTIEEVFKVVDKIKEFEDSINTIWLPEQIKEMKERDEALKKAVHG